MRLPHSTKLLRQRAIAIALLPSAIFAVTAITITALGSNSGSTPLSGNSDPIAVAVRFAIGYVHLFTGGYRWG